MMFGVCGPTINKEGKELWECRKSISINFLLLYLKTCIVSPVLFPELDMRNNYLVICGILLFLRNTRCLFKWTLGVINRSSFY